MNIDVMQKGDLDALVALFNETRAVTTGLPSTALTPQEFLIQIEGEATFLAKIDEKIVAFISIWVPDNFIHHLFVKPKHHGAGLGSALIRYVEDRFGRPLHLKCGQSNIKAIAFYESQGWVAGSVEIGPDGAYVNYTLPV